MTLRHPLLALLASTAFAPITKAGCGFGFSLAILNDTGGVVTTLPPGDVGQWGNPYPVQLLAGQSFRATIYFNSCCGGNTSLMRNGEMIQEWSAVQTWITDVPGYFTWTFEGNCNMAPPPLTRYFLVTVSSTTGIDPAPDMPVFDVGPIVVDRHTGTSYAECTSDKPTALHVEVIGLDGRSTAARTVQLLSGTNRVLLALPTQAQGLVIFRFTTTEGMVRTRKAVW